MANKAFKRGRCDSSSSDDCIIIEDSDDELNKNLTISKLDLSTSNVSSDCENTIIDTSFKSNSLTRKFSLRQPINLTSSEHTANQIKNICDLFQNEILSKTNKKVNFTINIQTANKTLKSIQKKKKKPTDRRKLFNPLKQSTNSNNAPSKDESNWSNCKNNNEIVASKLNLTEDQSIHILSCSTPIKTDTKVPNTELTNVSRQTKINFRPEKTSITDKSKISSNNDESQNDSSTSTILDVRMNQFEDNIVENMVVDCTSELSQTHKTISAESTQTKECTSKLSEKDENFSADNDTFLVNANIAEVQKDLADLSLRVFEESFSGVGNLSQKAPKKLAKSVDIWEEDELLQPNVNSTLGPENCSEIPDVTMDNTITNNTAIFFPSCLGSLPGLNSSENDIEINDIEKNISDIQMLEPNRNNVILDNEIPALTYKYLPEEENKPCEAFMDKIFHLHIKDIFNSERTGGVFLLNNIKYSLVRITGRVSYIRRILDNRILLKIDDNTGEICCLFQDFPDRLANRFSIAQHLENQSEMKILPKKQLITMGKKNDVGKIERYMNKTSPKDNPFLNSMTKIMLEKMLKDQPPTTKDIKLGDFLTISGKVVDLNELFIYIRYIRNVDENLFKEQSDNYNYPPISEQHHIDHESGPPKKKKFVYRHFDTHMSD